MLAGLPSPHSRRAYKIGIEALYTFAAGRPITYELLAEWRLSMAGSLSSSTVNARLCSARALVRAAQRHGTLPPDQAWDLLEIDGLPALGARLGNWLTLPQLRRLLAVPSGKDLRGRRNYCILAMLSGCAIRLDELASLDVETLQQRDGRWVLADLVGKGGRTRTVAVPTWVKTAISGWLKESKLTSGRLIRQLSLKPEGLSVKGIYDIVVKAGKLAGVPNRISPHDLRRTCARLCRENGADIEQIQVMLGHADINTTQRYLGTIQNLRDAPNDRMGI